MRIPPPLEKVNYKEVPLGIKGPSLMKRRKLRRESGPGRESLCIAMKYYMDYIRPMPNEKIPEFQSRLRGLRGLFVLINLHHMFRILNSGKEKAITFTVEGHFYLICESEGEIFQGQYELEQDHLLKGSTAG